MATNTWMGVEHKPGCELLSKLIKGNREAIAHQVKFMLKGETCDYCKVV